MSPTGEERGYEVRVTIYTRDGGRRTEHASFKRDDDAYAYVAAYVVKASLSRDGYAMVRAEVSDIMATTKVEAMRWGDIRVYASTPVEYRVWTDAYLEAWDATVRGEQ